MKKIITLFIIATMFIGASAFAGNDNESGNPPATTTITGKVFDKSTNEELAGVVVSVEGTDMKTYTDMDGNFSIEGVIPGKYNLNVSYISYKEKEVKNVSVEGSDKNDLNISLEQVD